MPRPKAASGPPSRYLVPVVVSTFRLLDRLSSHTSASLHDLSVSTGIPKSTVFRLLATLQHLDIVKRDEPTKAYRLSAKSPGQALALPSTEALRRAALPFMLELRNEFGETVNLGHLMHDRVVYIEVVPSEFALRLSERPGASVEAYCTALGRSILAFSPEGVAESVLGKKMLPRITEHTLVDPKEILAELGRIRTQGYAIESEEGALQATCIGAPVLDDENLAIGALSVSGPTYRFQPHHNQKLLKALRRAAREIGRLAQS
ncbi:MAG: IclR family transcriptional regulator [Bryobacteraceae bacterium]|nr:IclR family transcriptional regulator [Bryobacteraceae bacterium]